jgi:glucokinase
MTQDKLILGIDLGGTDCKCGIIDSQGGIVRKASYPTEIARGPDGVLKLIADHAREIIGSDKVDRVGMGVPGPMSSREGIVYEAPNLRGWINIEVRRILEEHLGLPVVLNNDANAAAYGEFWAGAGRGVQNMIMFTLGTGVGGGIILNGKLYGGPDDTAGELGHMVVNFYGPECGCGNKGCLEAYASATAIRRMVREGIAAGHETSIRTGEATEDFGAKVVYDAAVAGDDFAIDVLHAVGRALGIAAANVINIFNPDLIVFGGALAGAGDFIFGPLRAAAAANAFKKPASRCRIVVAQLGPDAGIVGAAGLASKQADC